MSQAYWEAKIKGIISPFNLAEIRERLQQRNDCQVYWQQLEIVLSHSNIDSNIIALASEIANASDRTVLNSLSISDEDNSKLNVSHLLSGEFLELSSPYSEYRNLVNLTISSQTFPESSPQNTDNIEIEELKELYWWLWRCLPEIICNDLGNQDNFLLPASLILPDASIWSYASLTSAIAGSLTGYETTSDKPQTPYLATFSFSPIQEIIKASRKMRDFWAGSWVLHYLSAKVCWKLAKKYGPDTLIYPSLFQQPLIDHWLLKENWNNFEQEWVKQPEDRAILTAGFPNVIVILLPQDKMKAAMQTAEETVKKEWMKLGEEVFKELENRYWTRQLTQDSPTWKQWLKNQWQTYWTALPLNNKTDPLAWQINDNVEASQQWKHELNRICQLNNGNQLFSDPENQLIQAVTEENPDLKVNIGSWWCYLFDQLRLTAGTVKSSRNWRIPTSFYPRSTISGLGSVVYPIRLNRIPIILYFLQKNHECLIIAGVIFLRKTRRVTERDTRQYWQRQGGLFDGNEQLNATEVLKRGLHRILPELLFNEPNKKIPYYYPDLSSGVAGWLKCHPEMENAFTIACTTVCGTIQQINNNLKERQEQLDELLANSPWGIPWVDDDFQRKENWPNPRLLNVKWLIEDFPLDAQKQIEIDLRNCIAKYFNQGNNPTDWYVIATGDGDGMSKWLKGEYLKNYADYMSLNQPISNNESINTAIQEISQIKKRMGPSTHNALSRALLDFSNRLVPYLTEERYAGRLIYSGGDDVLAYTNLWEWDKWLWDIRQCFKGEHDPTGVNELGVYDSDLGEFDNRGNYWRWMSENENNPPRPESLPERPLFTMGEKATVSFGVVIAHHSVPLAIALENLWEAEKKAKNYRHFQKSKGFSIFMLIQRGFHRLASSVVRHHLNEKKDAVQVRVLFGNGNKLQATTQFDVFNQWKKLIELELTKPIEPSLFEQAAQLWEQHPAPCVEAINPWTIAFCDRREGLQRDDEKCFQKQLQQMLTAIYTNTTESPDSEIKNWLKLAAFVLRNRNIKPIQGGKDE